MDVEQFRNVMITLIWMKCKANLPDNDTHIAQALKWKGLQNIGNTCYINATLQFLLPLVTGNEKIMTPIRKVVETLIDPNATTVSDTLYQAMMALINRDGAFPKGVQCDANELRMQFFDLALPALMLTYTAYECGNCNGFFGTTEHLLTHRALKPTLCNQDRDQGLC